MQRQNMQILCNHFINGLKVSCHILLYISNSMKAITARTFHKKYHLLRPSAVTTKVIQVVFSCCEIKHFKSCFHPVQNFLHIILPVLSLFSKVM